MLDTGIYQVNMTNPYSANEGAHGGFSGAYHAINRSSGSASQIELGTYNSSHSSMLMKADVLLHHTETSHNAIHR
jgi:hypothetical protein